jgi:hypothetical protein
VIQVEPSASYEAVAKFPTGLAGTLGVRVIDNAGATTQVRVTAGITEYPAGSGIYQKTLTAPASAGQYTLVWDDADGHWAIDELLVTSEAAAAAIGAGDLYVTAADLKTILRIGSGTYANEAIDIAVNTASRAIDAYKDTRFTPASGTRWYDGGGETVLLVHDLVSVSSLQIDRDDDGDYDETWVADTDYVLGPVNAAADGRPYYQLIHLDRSAYEPFPTGPKAVQVAASFGWAEPPWMVKQAAVLLANRFLARTKSAPLGILVQQAADEVRMARLGSLDKDAVALLDLLPSRGNPGFRSIQLS